MPDQSYQRTIVYPLEKPIADDLNQDSSQGDRSIRDTLSALLNAQSGVIGGSLQVVQQSPPALGAIIKAGLAFQNEPTDMPSNIGGVIGLNDLSPYKPIVLAADYSIAVPAPPGSNSRIDLIEVAYSRRLDNPQSRNFLDTGTGAFVPASVAKTLDFTVDGTLAYYAAAATPTTALAYKSGVSGASPVAPTVDTGYMALAYITVASGVSTIVAANISDQRSFVGSGRYIGSQDFFGSGTYVPSLGVTRIRIRQVGGGGGAGGCAGVTSSISCSGGGASGVYVENIVEGPITGGAVTIGGGGAGGTTGGSSGGDGGDTTVVVNGVTYVAKGGGGSLGRTSSGTTDLGPGGTQPSGSTAFRGSYSAGEPGAPGVGCAPAVQLGGNGGSNPFGRGAIGVNNASGNTAPGFGGGGGGTTSTAGGISHAGGPAAPGFVLIDEFV